MEENDSVPYLVWLRGAAGEREEAVLRLVGLVACFAWNIMSDPPKQL